MAIEITKNPQKITLVGTGANRFYYDKTLIEGDGTAYIDWVSGTSFQVCGNGAVDTNASPAVTSANPKIFFPVKLNQEFEAKGGAGGEVFNIYILPIE